MDQIKFKNSLDAFVSENEVIGKLVAKIKALPQFNTLKLDVELTLFVAKCLKTEFQNKTDDQIKAMIVSTMIQIHPFSLPEIVILNSQIKFLIDHSKVVPISKAKSAYKSASAWFFKKFG